jgi:glycerophosphoryl diester phosphodiesterase
MTQYLLFLTALVVLFVLPVAAAEPARPLVVAHRGLLLHAPENTLAGFKACLELRLGFEFDVQKTKDGQLVCIHDDDVKRTTNGTGKVSELDYDAIRKLDAGSWFDPKFANERVPSIDEILALIAQYKEREFLVAVDLKADGVEAETVRLAEKHAVLHRLLFIGNAIDQPAVRAALKRSSTKARTAVVANQPEEFATALAAADGDWVYFRYLPSREEMAAVRAKQKKSFLAGKTVAGLEIENWKRAAATGVDAILTDRAMELAAASRGGK